jgi:hypothetical protein
LKADHHAFGLAGIDGEDPRAKHSQAHPFDEGGIALAANDLFVHAPRFISTVCLTGDELAIDLELEILESRVLWQWKHVIGFADAAAAVHEGLFDFISKNPVGQANANVGAGANDASFSGPARRDDGLDWPDWREASAVDEDALR